MSYAYIDQELQDSGFLLLNSSAYNTRCGQRVNSFSGTIDYVKFYLQKYGTPTGTLTVNVRKVSDDSIIGTPGTIDVSTISTSATWYQFNTDVNVSTPIDIRITCEYSGGSVDNYIYYYIKASDVCTGCASYYPQPGTGWVDTSYDSTIIVYVSFALYTYTSIVKLGIKAIASIKTSVPQHYTFTALIKLGIKAIASFVTNIYWPSSPTYKVEIAFASNPFDASPTWTDVSADLRSYSINRGRQHELDRFESGIASIVLSNKSGNYWPNNTGGAYYPNVKLKKRIRISVIWQGVTYIRYVGYITDLKPSWTMPVLTDPIMTFNCADAISLISRQYLNIAGYDQQSSGTRINNVLNSIGFMAADRAIDTGTFLVEPSGILKNINAFDHIVSIALSEFGIFYIGANGYAVFESIGKRASYTSQGTFTTNYPDVTLSYDDILLYNQIRATRIGGNEQVINDTTSQTAYGLQQLVRSGLLHISDSATLAYANYLLLRYYLPYIRAYTLTVKPFASPADLIPKCCSFSISTMIKLNVPAPSTINVNYFIERIQEDYNAADPVNWTFKWQLSDAINYNQSLSERTETYRPTSNGTKQEWPLCNYYAHWSAVTENDAYYIYQDYYNHAACADTYHWAGIPWAAATISYVKIYFRVWKSHDGASGYLSHAYIKVGSNYYSGSDESTAGTATTYSYTWSNSPATGNPWTISELNSMEFGVWANYLNGYPTYCSVVQLEVKYTPLWS